jgi:hypothetical protein
LGFPPSSVPDSLPGSLAGRGEPGILWVERGGKRIFFVDAFSANDVESTRIIQQTALEARKPPRPYVALLNNRSDRPLRMLSFSSFLAREKTYDHILLAGELRKMAERRVRRLNPQGSIQVLPKNPPELMLEVISQKIPAREFTLVGMGNEKTIGRDFADFFLAGGKRWN